MLLAISTAARTSKCPRCLLIWSFVYSTRGRSSSQVASNGRLDAFASKTSTWRSGVCVTMSLTRRPRFFPPSLLTRFPNRNSKPSATASSNTCQASPFNPWAMCCGQIPSVHLRSQHSMPASSERRRQARQGIPSTTTNLFPMNLPTKTTTLPSLSASF